MKKFITPLVILGLMSISLVSCVKDDIDNEYYEIEKFGTGQGEVGDPVDDDDEEGK